MSSEEERYTNLLMHLHMRHGRPVIELPDGGLAFARNDYNQDHLSHVELHLEHQDDQDHTHEHETLPDYLGWEAIERHLVEWHDYRVEDPRRVFSADDEGGSVVDLEDYEEACMYEGMLGDYHDEEHADDELDDVATHSHDEGRVVIGEDDMA